jgi:Xaa-Pro aminopeptidase
MFAQAVYKARRDALRKGLEARGEKGGIVLLLGNDESPMNYLDNAYPFRQDSSFLYFFGLSRPGLVGTIDLESGAATLYGDDLSIDDIVWTGPEPSLPELAAQVGVGQTRPLSALQTACAATRLLYLPPYREETRRKLAELSGLAPGAVAPGASLNLIRSAIALREIKDQGEVAELEAATATSVAMHRAALAMARPGMVESEIAARVTEVAIAAGGGLSFPAIATTKGATLHNHRHDRIIQDGQLFLLDAGAEGASGYAGDLTTTFPVSRRFDERQRAIYEIVLSMGEAATALLGPGLPFSAAHDAAARAGVLGLARLGLMRGDPDEAVSAGAHALFFPHGLGHMIGLDVHDMENYGEEWVGYDGAARSPQFGRKSLRLAKPLRAGMVHSVEPGIYFIPELILAWKAEGRFSDYIDYGRIHEYIPVGGIRNEEDWLVTETGGRRLGPAFDKSVAAIEAARG